MRGDRMSILHIAFYPSDWLAGTRALSDTETGVYITLVAHMYEMAGPIERDDERLSRMCGCRTKASFVKSLNHLISVGKIIDVGGMLFNERAGKEIQNTTEKSSKAKAAAQSRWDKKPNKNNDSGDAGASPKHMPQPCQLEPELDSKREAKASPKNGARLSADWFLPASWGEWALSEGASQELVRIEAAKFKDYWIGLAGAKARKADWLATWRNWIRKAITDSKPKFTAITGGQHVKPATKSQQRMDAFIAGAKCAP